MKNTLLISLSLITQIMFAQLENNTWYFSPANVGIQFNFVTNVPSVVTGHASLTSLHGCGIASNPTTGAVQFYTDAVSVFDSHNLTMPNGTSLNGGTSCASKGDIVQVPGSCNRFYVFSNNANSPTAGSLYYSIVNMSLTGNGTVSAPTGDVEASSLNTLVTTNSTEAYTVARNPAGNSYWIIVPMNNSATINVYSITAGGITLANTFNTGYTFNSSMSIKYSIAAGKVAYISVVENDPALIIDFNSTTGVLSNSTIIAGTPVGSCTNVYNGWHDVEFSPDGTKLYLSKYRMYSPATAGRIYQYDLSLPTSAVTVVFDNLASTDIQKTVTGLQTGPDGKIYFIYTNTTTLDDRIIGVINNPNLAGAACNVNGTGINMGVTLSGSSRFSKPALFNNNPSKPIAVNDNATINLSCGDTVGTANINILNNDSNTNSSMVNNATVLTDMHGTAVLQVNNTIQYTSNPHFIGIDTVSYLLCDNNCYSVCDTGYVYIHIYHCANEGINENTELNNITIYPNPAFGELNINLSKLNGNVKLEVYDIVGKEVYKNELNQAFNIISLDNYESGVYIFKLSEKDYYYLKRVVIEK